MLTFSLRMVLRYGDTAKLIHIVSQQNKYGASLLASLRIHMQWFQPKEGTKDLWYSSALSLLIQNI